MGWIIDGYNLLNATGIVGRPPGGDGSNPMHHAPYPCLPDRSLERSRLALLNFLADRLDPAELARTTIVFDSHGAPKKLPRLLVHRGLTVRFAAQYDSADTMIEELIREDTAPRQLTVVSSDHRVRKAARRRRAKAVKSELWFAELCRRRHLGVPATAKPPQPLLEEEVSRWLSEFGCHAETSLSSDGATAAVPRADSSPEGRIRQAPGRHQEQEEKRLGAMDNPFPPGYAQELEE